MHQAGSGSLSKGVNDPVPHEPLGPDEVFQAPPESAPYPSLEIGNLEVGDPRDHPRIPDLDNDNPYSLFYTQRPNLFGEQIPDEWDFGNIIATDRPDFTDAPFTVGRKVTVVETGYTFRRISADGLTVNRRQLPEVLLRAGITNEFELRFRWNGYVMLDEHDAATGMRNSQFGGDDVVAGFKWEMVQQRAWRPMLTLVAGTTLPTGTNGISANQLQPFGNIVYGWGLRRWLYLKGSSGVDFVRTTSTTIVNDGFSAPFFISPRDNLNLYHQSISMLAQFSKRVGGFYEWFSFYSTGADDNRAANYLDTGLFIYATPNVQLDVRIGGRVSHRTDELFTGAGFSVRY